MERILQGFDVTFVTFDDDQGIMYNFNANQKIVHSYMERAQICSNLADKPKTLISFWN